MNLLRLALPVILTAVVAAVACKGGGALSLEEYFKRLEEIDDRSTERSDALQEELNLISDATAQDQDRIDAAQSAFPEFVAVLDEFLASLDKLEPPKEVQADHEEALDAGREASTFFDDAAADVAAAESLSEVDLALSVLNSPEFTAADQRFTDACVSLQKKADDNNIDVNLGCEQ